MILKTEKKEGETPLELINRLRTEGVITDEKATYAGRLDPMASGAMIILTGEDVHRKEEFYGKDKGYEVEILLGFATDSYDILGKVEKKSGEIEVDEEKVKSTLQSFVGKFEQEYPRYSSKVIAMKEVPEELPSREVSIYSIDYLGMHEVVSLELLSDIQTRIAKVKGDFRQEKILNLWKEKLLDDSQKYRIVKVNVRCSSGTYMRSLADTLGKKLGVPSLAYTITRKNIGQ
jgi:tRNA pseudouridine55 synthase